MKKETSRLKALRGKGDEPWIFWFYRGIDDDWEIAYRLVPQSGQILIGEVRIYPRAEGKWGGPAEEPAKVPAPGLTARLLRRVRVGIDRRVLDDVIRGSFKDPIMSRLLRQRGFDRLTAEPSRKRGGAALEPVQYALLAERYAELARKGTRSPVKQIALELGIEPKTIRHRLHIARRKLGFLTKVRQGKVGGELTAVAKELIRKRRRLTIPRGQAKGAKK